MTGLHSYNGQNVDPDDAVAHGDRGYALLELDRYDDALAAYDLALALDPDNVAAHSDRGYALRRLNRYEEALAAYNQALALEPDNAIVHGSRGNSLLELDLYEEALAAYDQALALDSDSREFHQNRGIALTAMGELDSALAEFDTAICLAPAKAGVSNTWAAAIFWHRRDTKEASDRFALVKGSVGGETPVRMIILESIGILGGRSA